MIPFTNRYYLFHSIKLHHSLYKDQELLQVPFLFRLVTTVLEVTLYFLILCCWLGFKMVRILNDQRRNEGVLGIFGSQASFSQGNHPGLDSIVLRFNFVTISVFLSCSVLVSRFTNNNLYKFHILGI